MKRILLFMSVFASFHPQLFGDNIPTAVKDVENKVVRLSVNGTYWGTGFFIEKDLLVTNMHVITPQNELVPIQNIKIDYIGKNRSTTAKVVKVQALSAIHDLALLKIKGYQGQPLRYGDLSPNENIYTVGFPGEKLKTLIGDKVQVKGTNYQFSFKSPGPFRGISGGPILNSSGQLIGILFLGGKQSGLGYGMQSSYLLSLQNVSPPNEMKSDKEIFYRAIQNIHEAASLGNINAQAALGDLYLRGGRGIEKDYKQAAFWLIQASEKNHGPSQVKLALLFLYGNGVPKNPEIAFNLLKASAMQGYPEALYMLGLMARKGEFARQSYIHAEHFFKEAARQGLTAAQFEIGKMYFEGLEGVDQNYKEAMKWFKEAAKKGHHMAQSMLVLMYIEGMGVKRNYRKALIWFKKSGPLYNYETFQEAFVQNKSIDATSLRHIQIFMGIMRLEGIGIEQNYEIGIQLLTKAGTPIAYQIKMQYDQQHNRNLAPYSFAPAGFCKDKF